MADPGVVGTVPSVPRGPTEADSKSASRWVEWWSSTRRDVSTWAYGGVALGVALGVLGILFHAWVASRTMEVFAFGVLVAGCVFLLCAGVGLLFGIPRSSQLRDATDDSTEGRREEAGKPVQYRPNTSLEQVSDWLTKMLVGVGLTNLNNLPSALDSLAVGLARGLPGENEGPASALMLAVVLYFAPLGFFFGYYGTRIHLASAFRIADDKLQEELTGLVSRVERRQQVLARVEQRVATESERAAKIEERIRLQTKYNDLLLDALYDFQSKGFERAIEIGEKVIAEFGPPKDVLFWIRYAAAYAQRHRYLTTHSGSPREIKAAYDKIIEHLEEAHRRNPAEAVFWIHYLSDADYPGKPKDEDDFEHIASEPEIVEFLAGKTPGGDPSTAPSPTDDRD